MTGARERMGREKKISIVGFEVLVSRDPAASY